MSSLRDSEFQRLTQRLLAAEQRAKEDRRARQQAEQAQQQAEQDKHSPDAYLNSGCAVSPALSAFGSVQA